MVVLRGVWFGEARSSQPILLEETFHRELRDYRPSGKPPDNALTGPRFPNQSEGTRCTDCRPAWYHPREQFSRGRNQLHIGLSLDRRDRRIPQLEMLPGYYRHKLWARSCALRFRQTRLLRSTLRPPAVPVPVRPTLSRASPSSNLSMAPRNLSRNSKPT